MCYRKARESINIAYIRILFKSYSSHVVRDEMLKINVSCSCSANFDPDEVIMLFRAHKYSYARGYYLKIHNLILFFFAYFKITKFGLYFLWILHFFLNILIATLYLYTPNRREF